MNTLLLVEDDAALVTIIEKQFQSEGYRVKSAMDAHSALESLQQEEFDLALIDIGLPDQDGFEVAREIKHKHSFPFVFLTAMGSPEYRLEGYELGAADYIPKPFHFRELLLRVQKILGDKPKRKNVNGSGFSLIGDTLELILKESPSSVRLSEREYSLLYHLIECSPRIISREEVLTDLWNAEGKTPSRGVDNTILRLRQLLGEKLSENIKAVRGVGYQWLEE